MPTTNPPPPVNPPGPSQRELATFFWPLALQAASQSLTYPLVAMVAARGPGGPLDLAGLAQSNQVMFFLAMLGAGIPTMGMVYGKTSQGYLRFQQVNYAIAGVVMLVHTLFALPPLDHFVFGVLIGLPLSIEEPARLTLLWTLPLQLLFFLRNPYQVALLNGKAAGRASSATVARVGLTAGMAFVFSLMGWVGPRWAVVCLTIPVAFEVILSRLFAEPFLRDLPSSGGVPPRFTEVLSFTIPLSMGGLLLALSGPLLGAFMARAPEPERVLPVYYLAMGLAGPMAFSASRLQSMVLAFPPKGPGDRATVRFAWRAGWSLGLVPLIVLLPPLADLYYVALQQLPPSDMPLLRVTAILLVAVPLCVAHRSQKEGEAAFQKRPLAVLAGQAMHVGGLVAASLAGLLFGLPGHIMGPAGLVVGNLAAAGTILGVLKWGIHRS